MMRYLPFVLFIIIGIGLAIGLTLNPREIPSALIGKPVRLPLDGALREARLKEMIQNSKQQPRIARTASADVATSFKS